MDALSYFLLLIMIVFFMVIVIKLVWYLLPFLIILMGISYLRFKYIQNKREKEFRNYQARSQTNPKPNSKIKDDVIDVEYTVRDADDK